MGKWVYGAALLVTLLVLIQVSRQIKRTGTETREAFDTAMPCALPHPDAIPVSKVLGAGASVSDSTSNPMQRLQALHNVCLAKQTMFDVDSDQQAVTTAATMVSPDGHFRFMDRQFASCDFSNSVLNGLQYESTDNTVVTDALCQAAPRSQYTVTKRTDFASEKQGMAAHVMDCGENAMVGVGFESDAAGNVRARYDCAADVLLDPGTQKVYYSGWSSYQKPDGADRVDVLNGHVAKCPDGWAMSYITGAKCEQGRQRTLVYKCAEMDKEGSTFIRNGIKDGAAPVPKADPVTPYVSDLADVTPPHRNTFDDLKDGLRPVTNAVGTLANALSVGHVKAVQAFEHVRKDVNEIRHMEIRALTKGGNVVGRALSKAVRAVGDLFAAIDRIFSKVIAHGIGMTVGAIDSVGDFGKNATFQVLKFTGEKIFKPIANAIKGVISGITNMLKTISNAVNSIGTDGSEAIKNGFKAVASALDMVICNWAEWVIFKPLRVFMVPMRTIKRFINKIKRFFG